MEYTNANILSSKQFDSRSLEQLFKVAKELEPIAQKKLPSDLLRGKVLASVFLEPSTRTRFSFETAMNRLGGRVVTIADLHQSSLTKGETLQDMAHTISFFSDVTVMRHPQAFSVSVFSEGSLVPVINAGDGSNEHPTQAIADIYTLHKEKGSIDGLTIAFLGDLKYSRVVHSLSSLLCHFSVKFIFVSPQALRMPESERQFLHEKGVYFEETENLEDAIKKSEAIYVTRIQRERFENQDEYERLYGVYIISKSLIERCNSDVLIMSPLPRCGEITQDTDQLDGACYFRQVSNGVSVRMALLSLVLGKI
ncbi:aspartate carbamoyltransferase [Candidatus Peregrinibacteria bacterium]|nr:aspartate carbamoyltransferase [Candidatus Peregrinibacteria bacterium]